MKQQEVFNKIGGIIKELNDQYKYLEANPEDLNSLELELFVANAHFLADHAEVLNKVNAQTSTARAMAKKEAETREEKFFEPVVRQPDAALPHNISAQNDEPGSHIDLTSGTPQDSYSFIIEEPEVIRHELIVDDADWDEEESEEAEQPITAITEEETGQVEEVDAPVIEDIEPVAEPEVAANKEEEVLTIHQRMSAQLGGSNGLVDHPAAQPISDLKQAISLNDKLLYIKDLFNGYSLAYSEAIEILNRFKSFEEAERFLTKNYVAKNSWESKADTTEKFYSVLKRRYL